MDHEINVLALVKGNERFIFLFDDQNRDETLRQLARFAADPELAGHPALAMAIDAWLGEEREEFLERG